MIKINTFLNIIFSKFSIRGLNALLHKSREVLRARAAGDDVLDVTTLKPIAQLNAISPSEAKFLIPLITKQTVQHFLLSKESYAKDLVPKQQKEFRWNSVEARCIKCLTHG